MHAVIGTAAATLLAVTVSVGLSGSEREAKAPAPARTASSGEAVSTEETTELAKPLYYDHGPREESVPALGAPVPQREQKEQQDDQNVWKTELFSNQLVSATVKSLSVNTSAGDVELLPSPSNQLEIQARVRARLGTVSQGALTNVFQDHVDVFEEKGVLHIEDKHKRERGWTVSLVVSIPGKLPLAANTASGDVKIRTGQGTISANTASGDVHIDLPRESVSSLNANTASGDVLVEVSSIEDNLNANTASGDVTFRVADPASPGSANANTASGDVLMILPPGVSGTFELETSSGDISLPRSFGIEVRTVDGETKAKGVVGNGPGKFSLSSASGNLKVELGHALPVREK